VHHSENVQSLYGGVCGVLIAPGVAAGSSRTPASLRHAMCVRTLGATGGLRAAAAAAGGKRCTASTRERRPQSTPSTARAVPAVAGARHQARKQAVAAGGARAAPRNRESADAHVGVGARGGAARLLAQGV